MDASSLVKKGVSMKKVTPKQIKALRIKNGWTQEEMAYNLGYSSRSSVSEIERGIKKPGTFAMNVLLTLKENAK